MKFSNFLLFQIVLFLLFCNEISAQLTSYDVTLNGNTITCFYQTGVATSKCFLVLTGTQQTWVNSNQACVQQGGEFAKPNSASDQATLRSLMLSRGYTAVWIAGVLTVSTNWQWTGSPTTQLQTSPTYWLNNNPPNPHSDVTLNDCVYTIPFFNYQWSDRACGYRVPSICEAASSNPFCTNPTNGGFSSAFTVAAVGRCFLVDSTSRTWYEARDNCGGRGLSLAKVDQASIQNALITSGIGKQPIIEGFWIGLTRSSVNWNSGATVSPTFWGIGQPARSGKCVRNERFTDTDFSWGNWECTQVLPPACTYNLPATTTAAQTTAAATTQGITTQAAVAQSTVAGQTTAAVVGQTTAAVTATTGPTQTVTTQSTVTTEAATTSAATTPTKKGYTTPTSTPRPSSTVRRAIFVTPPVLNGRRRLLAFNHFKGFMDFLTAAQSMRDVEFQNEKSVQVSRKLLGIPGEIGGEIDPKEINFKEDKGNDNVREDPPNGLVSTGLIALNIMGLIFASVLFTTVCFVIYLKIKRKRASGSLGMTSLIPFSRDFKAPVGV